MFFSFFDLLGVLCKIISTPGYLILWVFFHSFEQYEGEATQEKDEGQDGRQCWYQILIANKKLHTNKVCHSNGWNIQVTTVT